MSLSSASSALDRSRQILGVLVREYIQTGEPVGSFVIVRRAALNVSSATVRNVLARLEDEGYVSQPHTSAGRVPTDRGYRFYVNRLLESRRDDRAATAVEARLREQTGTPALIDDVLTRVPRMLSRVSPCVGFAVAPSSDRAVFQEIEFVPLGGTKLLVVLVTRGGQLSRKVIDVGEALGADDLRQAATYLNRELAGRPLTAVRQTVIEQVRHERMLCDALFARAMRLGYASLEDLPTDAPLFVDGTASLLDEALQASSTVPLPTLSALLKMVEEKQRLVRILNEYLDGPGVTVVIGTEHQTPDLRPFSLVVATFGDGLGTLGIIGPTRMPYSRAIAAVGGAALAVSRVLNKDN
jgi:heat-inducible transcriptional repressor